MTNGDNAALRGEMLRAHARTACSRAHALVAQYLTLTEAVAATEEGVAETMDRMAAQSPADAGRFRSLGRRAREQAAQLRQQAGHLG